MGDSVGYVVAVMAPGVIVAVVGIVLLLGGAARHSQRIWGMRLFYGGVGLLNVVPGVAGVIAVMTGYLMWPALFGALIVLWIGCAIFYGLRIHWANPAGAGPGPPST